eukprot:SM000009S23653  [mRNA]  locus=s9:1187439:1193264:- [translate_table: standard]
MAAMLAGPVARGSPTSVRKNGLAGTDSGTQPALEATWLKKAGMKDSHLSGNFAEQSDLLVIVDGTEFAVHKFPLYSRSDFFLEQTIEDSTRENKNLLRLPGLPGGPEAFKLVANFCYGIDISINATNIAALRCCATILNLTDDSKRGMGNKSGGNLLSLAEKHVKGYLKDWQQALAMLKACEDLVPTADAVGLVSRCTGAVSASAVKHHKLRKGEVHLDAGVINLKLDMFVRLVADFKSAGLPDEEIALAVEAYGNVWLPSIKQMSGDSSVADKQHNFRRTLEALVFLLPQGKGCVSIKHLLTLLRLAIMLNASKDSKYQLHRRAGELFDQASLEDLLLLEISDVQVLRLQKAALKSKADSLEAEQLKVEADFQSMHLANESLRGEIRNAQERLATSDNTFTVVQVALGEDKEALEAELNTQRARAVELNKELAVLRAEHHSLRNPRKMKLKARRVSLLCPGEASPEGLQGHTRKSLRSTVASDVYAT